MRREGERQTHPTETERKTDIAPVAWAFIGPHIKSEADVPVPFDQTTSAVATLVSFSPPQLFLKKGTNQKPTISKHADSSDSINVKATETTGQPASVCITGKPLFWC